MQRFDRVDEMNNTVENCSLEMIKFIIEQRESSKRYHEKILSVYTAFAPISIIILILTGIIDKPDWLETLMNNTVYIVLSILLGTYTVLLIWRLLLYKKINAEVLILYGALIKVQNVKEYIDKN